MSTRRKDRIGVGFLCAALAASACFLEARGAAQTPKFEPTWESLNSRKCPEWFPEARFGIFIHWGVYAVPSFSHTSTYSEWYWKWLTDNTHDGLERKFHERVYGKDFKYQDFGPMFKAEMFDPDEWADVFKRSGARYVVLTSKHHDGYCLWPAPDSPEWNSVEVGPKRDLCGDLAKAVRAKGLKMGFYYSLYEWYHPIYRQDVHKYVAEHMLPQLKDLVTRHKPALIFSDGEWSHPWETWRSTEFLAWLFNEGPNPGEVVVNDRWGQGMRSYCGDYWTTEYGHGGAKAGRDDHPWEENRGIGHSFGYNRAEGIDQYADRTACVRMLIYGTTGGPFRSLPWGRATARGSTLYLHVYDWPAGGKLLVPGLMNTVRRASLLADPEGAALPVARKGDVGVEVNLTGRIPREHATVVVLELVGAPDVNTSVYPSPDGSIRLAAETAQTHGERIQIETRQGAKVTDPQGEAVEKGGANVGFWHEAGDSVSWDFAVTQPGAFDVDLYYACADGMEGSTIEVAVDAQTLQGKIAKPTGGWDDYLVLRLGKLEFPKVGRRTLSVRALEKAGESVMNLKGFRLSRTTGGK